MSISITDYSWNRIGIRSKILYKILLNVSPGCYWLVHKDRVAVYFKNWLFIWDNVIVDLCLFQNTMVVNSLFVVYISNTLLCALLVLTLCHLVAMWLLCFSKNYSKFLVMWPWFSLFLCVLGGSTSGTAPWFCVWGVTAYNWLKPRKIEKNTIKINDI